MSALLSRVLESRIKRSVCLISVFVVQAFFQYEVLMLSSVRKYYSASIALSNNRQQYQTFYKQYLAKQMQLSKLEHVKRKYRLSKEDTYTNLMSLLRKSSINVISVQSANDNQIFQLSAEANFENFYQLLTQANRFSLVIDNFIVHFNTRKQNLSLLIKWMAI